MNRFGAGSLRHWPGYLLAVAVTFVALQILFVMDAAFARQAAGMIFTVAILLSAHVGGFGPGLLATTLSCLASAYYFLPPIPNFAISSVDERWQLAVLTFVGVIISGLSEARQRAGRRAGLATAEQTAARKNLRAAARETADLRAALEADITERQRMEEARQATEERYRALFEYAPDGIVIADLNSVYIDANASMCQMLGYTRDELIGLHASDIVTEVEIPHIGPALHAIKTTRNYHREWQFRRKDGSVFPAEVMATALPDGNLLGMIRDITERKQLESQFRQAQKMEAIGTLAGGIAHDFNNVLGGIVGYTELAKMESGDRPTVLNYLQGILSGSARATDLVRQILAFSRVQKHERKLIPLWPIVDEAMKLLRATIPATIQFDIVLPRRGPMALADSTQIHQVIMNLVTNAAQAIGESQGRLGVVLEEVQVTPDLAALHPGLRSGDYLRLEISDTGHGMDPATISRIFDSFFTTKAPGEGTGLGLAVVHGIMQSHDGVIVVYSQPGQGTRFHLYFPAHSGEAAEAAIQPAEIPLGHGERILLLDDEASLAWMARKILERLGYLADVYSVPAEALDAVRAEPQKYDLVVTDLTMPGMTGTDLAKQLLEIRPDLPIILSTGYSATLTPERVQALGIREMLLKPLTAHDLGAAVHRLIAVKKTG